MNRNINVVTDELNKIEERRKLALSATNTGIWDWDIIKDTLTWDEAMLDIYGLTAKQFGGRYEAWTSLLHPDDLKHTTGALHRCLSDPSKAYFYRFRINRLGETRVVSGFGNCIRDKDGKPIRMVGINILEPPHCVEHDERAKRNDPCDICPSRFMKMYETV
jgi:PAS domain S-box-containing protein